MTDDMSKPWRPSKEFVRLEEPWEVHYWTTFLKCTPDELRAAIAEVGQAVARIRAYLAQG